MKRATRTVERAKGSGAVKREANPPPRLSVDERHERTPEMVQRKPGPSPTVSESTWEPWPEYDLEKMPRGV